MQYGFAVSDNNLVNSLLALSSSAENQEMVDYLSEHLYIQSHIVLPRIHKNANQQALTSFYRSCQKLYCAGDDNAKNQAMAELRMQLAL